MKELLGRLRRLEAENLPPQNATFVYSVIVRPADQKKGEVGPQTVGVAFRLGRERILLEKSDSESEDELMSRMRAMRATQEMKGSH